MSPFDPNTHLRTYSRKQKDQKTGNYVVVDSLYLDVRWRVLWVRTEHPEAQIVTDLIEQAEGYALFRATVTLPGGASATGWGSETRADFNDYLEKAETKALGRALAHLGFGTQFATEMDEDGSVADSPIDRKPMPTARELAGKPEPKTPAKPASPPPVVADAAADDKRASTEALEVRRVLNKELLGAMAEKNMPQSQVATTIKDVFGLVRSGDLTNDQMADVVAWVRDAKELRYDADGKATLVDAGPGKDDGLIALEDLAFEVVPAG